MNINYDDETFGTLTKNRPIEREDIIYVLEGLENKFLVIPDLNTHKGSGIIHKNSKYPLKWVLAQTYKNKYNVDLYQLDTNQVRFTSQQAKKMIEALGFETEVKSES